MISSPTAVLESYWTEFEVTDDDLDFIDNLLLEREVPLTSREMTSSLVEHRLQQLAQEKQRAAQPEVESYLPGGIYQVGQRLRFPSLSGEVGQVTGIRPGINPDLGTFDVIQVDFEGGSKPREFAAQLEQHGLNLVESEGEMHPEEETPQAVLHQYGELLANRLEDRLTASSEIVRIAGRWFHAGLLAEINEGHLNLAEAVLDVSSGGPLPTRDLLEHMELPPGLDPVLTEFSADFALQEDPRFDEVGPAGRVLWFLKRLEPTEVLQAPERLRYESRQYDRGSLDAELLQLEALVDDEHGEQAAAQTPGAPVTLPLLFPHWHAGSLPLSSRLQPLFPTAYEAPRIRFVLVDGHSGRKFPGWVVRAPRYVFGLRQWYQEYDIPAGGLVSVRSGEEEGEVIVEAVDPRKRNDWIRTVTVSGDGRIGFTMLKHPVGSEYDDRMIVGVIDEATLDEAWADGAQVKLPLNRLVPEVFRELSKLNPQTTVHAQSLYSAINVIRRLPPGPIFAELGTQPYYEHVGDHYWRLNEENWRDQ